MDVAGWLDSPAAGQAPTSRGRGGEEECEETRGRREKPKQRTTHAQEKERTPTSFFAALPLAPLPHAPIACLLEDEKPALFSLVGLRFSKTGVCV